MSRIWVPSTLSLVALAILLLISPKPGPSSNQNAESTARAPRIPAPDLIKNGVPLDPTKSDALVIGGDTLWFPKRYAIELIEPGIWQFSVYWPGLEVRESPQADAENGRIDIRLRSSVPSPFPLNTANQLPGATRSAQFAAVIDSAQRNTNLSLFEVTDGATKFFYSDEYFVPRKRPRNYAIACDVAAGADESEGWCEASYWLTNRQFLKYRFHSDLLTDWKSIDLSIRRLVRAARLNDGEVDSLGEDIGHDESGRRVLLVGEHALHIPINRNSTATGDTPKGRIVTVALRWPEEDEEGLCGTGFDCVTLIRIRGVKKYEIPIVTDPLAHLTEAFSFAEGPFETDLGGIWEFRRAGSSASFHYALEELDHTGRHATAQCNSGRRCNSFVRVAPGLSVRYDFGQENMSNWSEIHKRVRNDVLAFLDEE